MCMLSSVKGYFCQGQSKIVILSIVIYIWWYDGVLGEMKYANRKHRRATENDDVMFSILQNN